MTITKQLLTQAKSSIALAIIASAVSAGAGIAIIAGINAVLKTGINDINLAIGAYVGLLVLLLTSNIWSQVLLVNIGYNMVFELRKNLVNRILNTPISHQEQIGSTDIYNVLTRDVTMVSNAARQLWFTGTCRFGLFSLAITITVWFCVCGCCTGYMERRQIR